MRFPILLSFFCIFMYSSSSFGQTTENTKTFLQGLTPPQKVCTISDEFLPPDAKRGLIIIEDAHCNKPIQKKIMKTVNYFLTQLSAKNNRTLPLIMQEGGSYGEIKTDLLRKEKTIRELHAFLDRKLHQGEMGAAEYLHARDQSFTFFGIENPDLYMENYRHFMTIAKNRKEIDTLLKTIEEHLSTLRTLIFSDALQSLYTASQTTDVENLDDHLTDLYRYTKEYAIDLARYPTLQKYYEIKENIHAIDPNTLENDLTRFNREQETQFTLDNTEQIIQHAACTTAAYPILYKYVFLNNHIKSLNFSSFIKERFQLEDTLLQLIAYTDEEKELVAALRRFFIIEKILSLSLTPEDYEYYHDELQSQEDMFYQLIRYIISYIPSFTTSLNLKEVIEHAGGFYTAVRERDDALIENITKAMHDTEHDIAITIIGGFHTHGITERLRKTNTAYLVVTPTVEDDIETSTDKYYAVLERFWTEGEE